LEQQGRFDDAIAEETKALRIEPRFSWAYAVIVRAYALSGRHSEAQKALDGLLGFSKHDLVSNYSLAGAWAAMGDKNRALDDLEKAFAKRAPFLNFIRSDPEMDALRSEPRFQELVRRMNFPRQVP
jgi:eukaryotic-like serine/threonine-protein kinase